MSSANLLLNLAKSIHGTAAPANASKWSLGLRVSGGGASILQNLEKQRGRRKQTSEIHNAFYNSYTSPLSNSIVRKTSESVQQSVILFLAANPLTDEQKTRISHRQKISRDTFYRWCRTDPKFAEAVEDAAEQTKDYVEDKLMEHIKTIFINCFLSLPHSQKKLLLF